MPNKADKDWFMQQVQSEHRSLRAYVRGLGVRIDAVDDIAHDALIIAMKKLNDFDRNRDFGAWVRGIAKRVVMNHRQKEARRAVLLSEHMTDVMTNLGIEATVAESNDQSEQLTALRQCLASLPEKSRQLLHARYYEDQAPANIAGRLDKSSENVRQVLFRLRKQMLGCVRQRLAEAAG